MSATNAPNSTDESVEERLERLEAELAEAKARIRRLETGGLPSESAVTDQYDKPLVTEMSEHTDVWFRYERVKQLYAQAGVTDPKKIRRRLKALVNNGVLVKKSENGRYFWAYNGESDV